MSQKTIGLKEAFEIRPIGYVRRSDESGIHLEILEPYRPGLKQLDQFTHVIVLWWAHQHDNEEFRNLLQTNPPYAEGHPTGVFACRSPYRPNPVAMTTCKLLGVDEENGAVRLAEIDALDGTPIVDLKSYFPVCDRVKDARIPEWLQDWPEWMPENGIGLESHEEHEAQG